MNVCRLHLCESYQQPLTEMFSLFDITSNAFRGNAVYLHVSKLNYLDTKECLNALPDYL